MMIKSFVLLIIRDKTVMNSMKRRENEHNHRKSKDKDSNEISMHQ